jgi:hypothetical protein
MAHLFSTVGNAFYLTGVQCEVGKNATDFEHRSYGEEFALCQRYYQTSSTVPVGQISTNIQAVYNTAFNYSGSTWTGVTCQLPVEMRVVPSVTLYTNSSVNDPLPGRVGHYQLNIAWGASLANVGGGTNGKFIIIASSSPGRGATGPCLILWNFTADAELS